MGIAGKYFALLDPIDAILSICLFNPTQCEVVDIPRFSRKYLQQKHQKLQDFFFTKVSQPADLGFEVVEKLPRMKKNMRDTTHQCEFCGRPRSFKKCHKCYTVYIYSIFLYIHICVEDMIALNTSCFFDKGRKII